MVETVLTVIILLAFWPAMLASLVLMIVAIPRANWKTALLGAALATPFLLYLFGTPRFGAFVPLAALLYYSVPLALRYRRKGVALVCAMPSVALVGTLAWVVTHQDRLLSFAEMPPH